jgi:muramoyltetrapeptide carboxypeptidase
VAVVSPASTPLPERVEHGLAALRALGLAPQPSEHILAHGPLYFAGTPKMRLSDLHQAFADDQLRAIFSTRGGYGANYLLDDLDLDRIAEGAKPLVGYSDLTALHLWMLDQIQLPAFHGPMLSADFAREDGVHLPSLQAALPRVCAPCAQAARAAHSMAAASALSWRCWVRPTSRRPRANCSSSKT